MHKTQLKNQVNQLISLNKLRKALELILSHLSQEDDNRDIAVSLQAELTKLEELEIRQHTGLEQESLFRNQLIERIQKLLTHLVNQEDSQHPASIQKSQPKKNPNTKASSPKKTMKILSTFLSHSHHDKPFVEKVAEALGRRGIIAWLDKNELHTGQNLDERLVEAVKAQGALSLFLSEASVRSDYVGLEIETAISLEEEGRKDSVIPIFLGDREELVSAHPLLDKKWRNEKGNVNRLGFDVRNKNNSTEVTETGKSIAKSLYNLADIRNKNDINIYMDQRGEGERKGKPNLSIIENKYPVLVFRSDQGERGRFELLSPQAWEAFTLDIKKALGVALSSRDQNRIEYIHLYGNYQLSLAFWLGNLLDRSSSYKLTATSKFKKDITTFSNESLLKKLDQGNIYCAEIDEVSKSKSDKCSIAAIYIGTQRFLGQVENDVELNTPKLPFIYIPTQNYMNEGGAFDSDEQVHKLVSDVIGLIDHLKIRKGLNTVRLYMNLPVPIVPMLGSLWTYHLTRVLFMDWDMKNHTYVEYKIPIN